MLSSHRYLGSARLVRYRKACSAASNAAEVLRGASPHELLDCAARDLREVCVGDVTVMSSETRA